jgi:tetrahydromethanopterin S-methyltransferase subunit G
MRGTKRPTDSDGEEKPPIGRSWRVLYAIVIGNLALLILLFYAFTKAFS